MIGKMRTDFVKDDSNYGKKYKKQFIWIIVALFIISFIFVVILDYQKTQSETDEKIRELEDELHQNNQDLKRKEAIFSLEVEQHITGL